MIWNLHSLPSIDGWQGTSKISEWCIESTGGARNEGTLFLYLILPPCMGNDQMSPALSASLSP